MFAYLLRRIGYALPIMAGVALVCFALVHLAPGDPLVSILPPDASADLAAQMRTLYGFDRSYPEQFAVWVWRALQGVSVPHYWLGMVMVIIFSAILGWLPATGGGPGDKDWAWDWNHLQYMVLPAITMSVIPMGIIARTVRALVAEILAQEFIVGLRAKGLTHLGIFAHVVKNAAPTALAVMGLQGTILVLAMFFVVLNLLVDVLQTLLDPRIARA